MTAVTGWTVHYGITDSNDVTIASYNANDNGVELTRLEKGTSYTVSVAASNSAGIGQFTTRTISTLIDRKYRKYVTSSAYKCFIVCLSFKVQDCNF